MKGRLSDVGKESAHSAGMGERAGVVLFSQWNDFCELRERALRRRDTDSVHDLRVASRRMRATVDLLAPFIAGRTARRIPKDLRRVTRELGHLRNIDEAIIYFGGLEEPLPALSRLLPEARLHEMRAVRDVLKALPLKNMERILREAVGKLARIPHDDQDLPVYLSETSIRRYQAVHDLHVPATIPENVETRHRLRIAIKKWRYLLETLGQVSRQDYTVALENLKEYQTLLGSLNDMVEFAALCASQALPRHERERIAAALARDSAAYLERFIEIAAARPLQYTFSL